jgi:hypothetical protein
MANIKMPFGKYKNKRLSKIPTEYLEWCRDKCDTMTDDVRRAVEDELADREATAKANAAAAAAAAAETAAETAVGTKEAAAPRVVKVSPVGQTLAGETRMVFRNLALKYHPDRGGTPEAMKALNDFHEAIQELITRTFTIP